MGVSSGGRVIYRTRQFILASIADLKPLAPSEYTEVQDILPAAAWPLFESMSRADQRHSLSVMRTVRRAGHAEPAILQAALLHDCAKGATGVRLWHRVAMVLAKALWPAGLAKIIPAREPERGSWRHRLWAYVHHPRLSAASAAAAGCDPLAVLLIEHHQDRLPVLRMDAAANGLLAALQAADNDN